MNEIRFKMLEGRVTQAKEEHALMEKAAELNASAVDMCERITRQNASDILGVDGKQTQVERKLRSMERAPSGNSNEGIGISSMKLTPKQPIFDIGFLPGLRID